MKMKQGVCEAPMRHSGDRCILRAEHRGAHELSDGTEYFMSDSGGNAASSRIWRTAGTAATPSPTKPFIPAGINPVIGPVYSTRALMTMWGVSRSTVSKKAREGRVLAIKVQGRNLFPEFQFDDGQVRPDVMKIVDELRECADPFTIALWLQTPMADDPKTRSPLVALNAGRHRVALNAARRAAARWSA